MKDARSWSGLFGQRDDQEARVLPFRPREKALVRELRPEEILPEEILPEEILPEEILSEELPPREDALSHEEALPEPSDLSDPSDPSGLDSSDQDSPDQDSPDQDPPSETRPPRRLPPEAFAPPGPRRIPEPIPLRPSADVTPLRRHRGARLRHSRRSLLLRLTRPFLLALAIVGVPLALVVWFFRSPVFALSELNISSEQGGRVSEAWIRKTLEPAWGWNLPRLPLPWIDNVLKHHSWVQATALRKELPNRLYVQVIERQEVAMLLQAGAEEDQATFWYLDSEGAKIAPYKPTDGEIDLPIITVDLPERDTRGALALLEEMGQTVARGLPFAWTQGLSEIEVLGERDFRIWTADLPFPLLVRSGTLAQKTPYLEELLPEIVRRYEGIAALDLRFAGKIILQPKRLG